MLAFDDPLPRQPARVLIAGVTGAGKSTLARRLSVLWDLPYTELDSLFHGPGWTKRESFEADVAALAGTDRWITEWGYWGHGVGEITGRRAELAVWLDLPRRVALPRLIRRTVRRSIHREVLWNGNIEPGLHTFFTSRDDNIIRWEMKTHGTWRKRMPEVEALYPDLPIVRIGSSGELAEWLAGPASR